MLFMRNLANVAQRMFKNRDHAGMANNYIEKHTSMYKVQSNVLRKLRADFVYDNVVIEISLLHV